VSRLAMTLLVIFAASGCAKSTARPPARMSGPQGVAVYRGYGTDRPGVLRPLVAVANTRGDDLRLLDPVTDKILQGPTLVSALAVPTATRPSLIAAGPLHDLDAGQAAVDRADLLVVAPREQVARPLPATPGTFGLVIQSVVSWDERTRVHETMELAGLVPEGALTALVVAPVPESDGAGGWRPAAGKARVLATTTSGALVSIEARRDELSDAILLDPPVVQLLGFTVLDLAVSPDGTRVYGATLDPIPSTGGLLGVAEFDNTAAPGAMGVRALSARLGTTLVATLEVAPFVDNVLSAPELDTFGPPALRVFAVLDPSGCGRDRSIPCGIATIDPVLGQLAPDPAGELPFQLPIALPGEVQAMAVSGPPARSDRPGFLKLDPGSGVRWTNGVAGVATTDGRIYLVDLSHFAVANSGSPLAGPVATRLVGGTTFTPSGTAHLGLWVTQADGTALLQFDAAATGGIAVTPGYTKSETFTIIHQGGLPALGSRKAVVHADAGAPSWLAIQEASGLTAPGSEPWRGVARLYDPRLAIRIGDLVVLEAFPSGVCPSGRFELVVTGFLPPDPVLYPGGALAVAAAPVQPDGADTACLTAADTEVTASILARSLLLVGSSSGVAGRPGLVTEPAELSPRFEFKYEDERLLQCPIMPDDPLSWPPPPSAIAACQANVAACRTSCERLVFARRARRSFYMTDACPPGSLANAETACSTQWVTNAGLTFPMPVGPVVAFKVGTTNPNPGAALKRGSYYAFSTASGLLPGFRAPSAGYPGAGSAAPYGVVFFDRSATTGLAADALHGFAAYADNLILDFAPWSSSPPAVTIR
jgi:hypothetical protein